MAASKAPAPAPRTPPVGAPVLRRIERIALDELGYVGEWADVCTSLPLSTRRRWQAGAVKVTDALAEAITAWSLRDAAGRAAPITAATIAEVEDVALYLNRQLWERWAAPLVRLIGTSSSPSSAPDEAASPGGTPSPSTPSASA